MANIKVSEMSEATSFDDGDYTMIVQANQNKKIARENILGDIEGDISTINTNIGNINNLIVDNNLVGAINKIASYSTTPVKIGEWYDGRDILKRIIHLGAWQQQTGTITIPETPIDILVNAFYTFKLSNGRWYPKFVGISNIIIQNSTTLYFQVTENLSVVDSHIILEYVEPQN